MVRRPRRSCWRWSVLRLPVGADARHGANLVVVRRTDLSATVRYHERLQPQPTFSSIIGLVLDADRGFLSQHFGPSSRVTTREGEYGVWIAVHGRYRGGPASRWIGAVMVGEFATALEVLGLAPEHFATVEALGRDLMHTQTFDMGQRPRQFFYKPPLGWHGLLSGMTANWYSLEFPRDRSIIVVPPARHIEGDPGEELEATVASLEAGLSVDDVVRERVRARCGAVRGRWHARRGPGPTRGSYSAHSPRARRIRRPIPPIYRPARDDDARRTCAAASAPP